MEWSVWSLNHVERAHRDVIVILLAWNRFSTRVGEELKKHSQEFGHLMSYKGVLVLPYDDRMREALVEITAKPWPEAVKARIEAEQYPFLLIIDRDFRDFDPCRDQFAFVWFSDLKGHEDTVPEVLDAIARKIDRREDLFAYLAEVAAAAEEGKLADRLAGLAKYVDLKLPVIPGMLSINAGAIWAAVMGGAAKGRV